MSASPTSNEETLMDLNQTNADKTGIDRDGRAKPAPFTWIIPALVSVLVALIFFASLAKLAPPEPVKTIPWTGLESLPEVSRQIVSDLKIAALSQVKTFGTIGLYALIPGVLGSIYRKKFWHWFLTAFAILFIFNLIGYVAFERSVSSDLLHGLHYNYWTYVKIEAGLVALLLIFRLRRDSTAAKADRHGKNIVICLDGTWNHPGQTDWGYLAQTNVFKLFESLDETKKDKTTHHNAARCKRLLEDGHEKQVAYYYNGVGNKVENSLIGQKIGGAFGLGAEAIKERAYLDVVRVYKPGDRIFIFGFSRGAALARMVASALDKRGVPKSIWTLRLFGRHRPVKTSKEHIAVPIEVLGCWDTVGAFGISKDILGIPFQRINLLKDLTVPISVKRAYHLLALDENRDSFEPTLMDPDPVTPSRIVEVWFSGNHSNIGGGFATDGLSDHALSFMLKHVSSGWDPDNQVTQNNRDWGLYLKPGKKFKPNPLGKLRVSGGAIYERRPRRMPMGSIIHDSVFKRIRDEESAYVPDSLFVANQAINSLRNKVTGEVKTLQLTDSIDEDGVMDVEKWVKSQLTVQTWTKHKERIAKAQEREEKEATAQGRTPKTLVIDPKGELDNARMASSAG